MSVRHRRIVLIAALISGSAIATACGGGLADPTPDTTPTLPAAADTTIPQTSFPEPPESPEPPGATQADPTTSQPAASFTVVDARDVEVTIESTDRLIPLDGDVAEIVFALGLGDRVVATDLSATYPPAADALPQIGYQRALSTEPILDFEPTLLIGTDAAGPPETIADLERLGIPVVIVPTDANADGPARKIGAVAEALGEPELGAKLAAEVQSTIDRAIAGRPDSAPPLRVVALYVRGTNAQLVLGRNTGIHWLIEAAGAVDLANELDVDDTAPITSEAMLMIAPDIILVPSAGLASVGGVDGLLESIPALAETPAGQHRTILDYDDQLMLGNGPRTGAFLVTMIDDFEAARSTIEATP